MPIVNCPILSCEYATPDLDAVIVDALLTTHATTHSPSTGASATRGSAAKIERVERPTVTLAGSSEDWKYFVTRWQEYATATKVTGTDKILQLLECCDDQLRKDLTRSSVIPLTTMAQDDVLKSIRSLTVRD